MGGGLEASVKKVTSSLPHKIIKGSVLPNKYSKGVLVLTKRDVLLYCEGLTVEEFRELLKELTNMYARRAMF